MCIFSTGRDFISLSLELVFPPGESGQEICHNLTLIDDAIYEETETYTLSLSSPDDDVNVASPTASFTITDEVDSMYTVIIIILLL